VIKDGVVGSNVNEQCWNSNSIWHQQQTGNMRPLSS